MGDQIKNQDKPPAPGGDPAQPDASVPVPPAQQTDENHGKDKSGYGHIGNNEVPRPKSAPPPHQIF